MRRPVVLLLPLLLPAVPALAADTVDLEVGSRDRVLGTLRPAGDRETFLVDALRGSSVRATLRRTGATTLAPTFAFVDAVDAPLGTAAATRTGARLSRATLAATGPVRFRVTGDGADGDYRLDLTFSPRRTWTGASEADLAPGEEATFAFPAPAGATATIQVLAPRRSAFRATLLSVTDPDAAVTVPAAAPPAARAVMSLSVVRAGEHVVRFRNDGAAAGAWTVSVRLRPPRVARTTVDIRDAALAGTFGGSQVIFGRLADPARDTTLDPGASLDVAGTDLEGVTLSVPAGTIAFPAVISMAAVDPLVVDGAEGAASATVQFGPSGTTFQTGEGGSQATVTIPFDPDSVDDATADLSIVVEDADGNQSLVVPVIDGDTATFPVSHFSRFQAKSSRPRPLRGFFSEIELTGRTLPGFGSEIVYGRNGLRAAARQRVGPTADAAALRTLRRTSIGWSSGYPGTARLYASYEEEIGNPATVATVGEGTVRVVSQSAGGAVLERGRLRGALVATETGGAVGGLRFHAMLERTKGDPTRANLAGAWHASVLEVHAAQTPDTRVAVTVVGQETELTVAADGRAVPGESEMRRADQVFPVTAWRERRILRAPRPGSLDPDGPEAVLRVALGAGGILPAETRLVAVLRGEVLVGGASAIDGPADAPEGGAFRVVVLVRAGSRGALAAESLLAQFAVRTDAAQSAPWPLRFEATRGRLAADGGDATLTGLRDRVGHDGQGLATLVPGEAASISGSLRVGSDGRVVTARGVPGGFLTPRSGTLVLAGAQRGVFPLGVAVPTRGAPAK